MIDSLLERRLFEDNSDCIFGTKCTYAQFFVYPPPIAKIHVNVF